MTLDILRKLRSSEDGATGIEYGLIAALVALAIIGAVGSVGTTLNSNYFEKVSGSLDDVNASSSTSSGG